MRYHYQQGIILPFVNKYYKQLIIVVAAIFMATFAALSLVTKAETQPFSVEPWEFVGTAEQCGGAAGTDTVTAAWVEDIGADNPVLKLEKLGDLSNCASAGADIVTPLVGQDISQLNELDFEIKDGTYCGAGSPRFNVSVGGTNYFLGCTYGATEAGSVTGWTHVTFDTTGTFGGVTLPVSGNIDSISLVMDEPGTTLLDNISVNGDIVGEPAPVVDEEAPTAPVALGASSPVIPCGGLTTIEAVVIDWSDSTDNVGVVGYQYNVVTPNQDWTNPSILTSSEYSGAFNDGEGAYTYRVRAVDEAGNYSAWSNLCTITYDNPNTAEVLGAKDECKNGGWMLDDRGFKNQGDCVSFFATKEKNAPAAGVTTNVVTTRRR